MRARTTYILLGITIALIAWIVIFERKIDTSTEAAIKKTRVVNFDPAEVTEIRIKREDGRAVLEPWTSGDARRDLPPPTPDVQ